MKTIFCVIISIFALVMSGCSDSMSNSVSESVSDPVVEPVSAEMPDIVFKKCTAYNRHENDLDRLLTFIDKNGNCYSSSDSEIYGLSNEELIEKLKSGDKRITKSTKTRDADELRENFDKLLKVAENKKYELVYPEVVPTVEYDHITWYGLYYDKDGNLLSLPIHEHMQTEIDANDDRANEIYKWYSGTAKTIKNFKIRRNQQ